MQHPSGSYRCWALAFLLIPVLVTPVAARAPFVQSPPFWTGYARNAQHTAVSPVAAQSLSRIRWRTIVDRRPQYSGNELFIHYGSPLVTQGNTVVVPVKTGKLGTFQVEGHRASDGRRLWIQHTNYRLPPHDWTPSFSPTLLPSGQLAIAAGGGMVLIRTKVDSSGPVAVHRVTFFGTRNPAAYLTRVFINTPLTTDAAGNLYFGFQVTGPTPLNLQSGIARISNTGIGTWVSAASAAGDPAITKVVHNCAPALSSDGQVLYVAVNDTDGTGSGAGYLLALDSQTLGTLHSVRLKDPVSGYDAGLYDASTASPTVGPDGDVYYGVLENPLWSNHERGWLLHFDANLATKGAFGAFGWDDTPSIVPAAMVPSYLGTSSYLLMTKYNNYADGGGDGVNRIAILDPNDPTLEPISGAIAMREILSVAGPTPDPEFRPNWPNAVREWCINTAAIDPISQAVLANNEDGTLYRWDMTTGALSESIGLTPGIGEAYTPTVIGPDGTVYAINNATLFAVGD